MTRNKKEARVLVSIPDEIKKALKARLAISGKTLKAWFIEKAMELKADIIGTSALLTTTMAQQKHLEEELKTSGLRDRFKTIVGGAPVTARWAARIGADAYAEDAQEAVKKVSQLLGP